MEKQVNPIQARMEIESKKLTKLEDSLNLIEKYSLDHVLDYKTRQRMPSTIYRIEFDTQYKDSEFRSYINECMINQAGLTFVKLFVSEDNKTVTQLFTLNICAKNI